MARYIPNWNKRRDDMGYDQYTALDDPEAVMEMTHWPIIGKVFAWWYDWNEYQDRKNMDEDRYHNTGETWENSNYKWFAYRNKSYAGTGYSSMWDAVEASEAVVELLYRKFKR